MPTFPSVSSLKTPEVLLDHWRSIGVNLPFDAIVEPAGPLASPFQRAALQGTVPAIGNRFAILPMEGWDGTTDGKPTDLTRRRWVNFGLSGAKLIWGGEAVAVRQDGRANPNQLMINDANLPDLIELRELLEKTHVEHFGRSSDLLVGLQLTHSGRFARPNDKRRAEPRVLYRHPLLDSRVGISNDGPLLSDDDLERLIEDFIRAGRLAHRAGYTFVDLKQCHGYLGHEFLSSFDRPGKFGGSFENRTRLLRQIVAGLRAEVPNLQLGTRVSLFDFFPFQPGADRIGVPSGEGPYAHAFGGDGTGLAIDFTEPHRLMDLLEELGIDLVCTSAGSPYYNPHILRPAAFPPSDGYLPPEDPFLGVARQIAATAELKRQHPRLTFVGSGYSYLQEWLPNVAQAAIRQQLTDFIGLGRMVLSYPDLPADVLAGKPLRRKSICRTFSDCTTAPRNGMVSGCYPLDPFYKQRPERTDVQRIKGELAE